MATNLDQAILDYFRAQQGGSGYVPGSTMDQGGQRFQATYTPPTSYGMDGIGQTQSIESILGYDPNKTQTGDAFNVYKADGTFSNQDVFKPDRSMQDLMMFLAAAGGIYGLANMGAIPSMGAESAAGGVGNAGGFIGEGTTSGIPAWDGAGASLGQNGTFLGEGVSSGVPAWDGAGGAAFGGGAATKAATTAATSLIPGISDKALGIGATVLGGALGSQETPGQTTERKMDPRLDQYVYGTNGLIPSAAGLLASQMPQAQQVGQQLNTMGTGLLGRGIAPNGFERFTKGRY